MRQWLSMHVKKRPEVGMALSDLEDNIREYEDAAKPSACRGTGGSFWSSELTLFRPDWKLFVAISVMYAIAGIIFSWFLPSYQVKEWADLALKVTIPVFVIGVSIVILSRSIGESEKFAGEYLNDSCRTSLFCCLTLVALLCAIIGYFLSSIELVSDIEIIKKIFYFFTIGICIASVGMAIDCLAMLAFVIREMFRCSVLSESGEVVLQYAGRKITWGYLKEIHKKFFVANQSDYLKNWCAGKAIHPPSQYYLPYIHPGSADNNIKIELDEGLSGKNVYKDYDLKGLERLDKYLMENNAELYLSSPFSESERNVLGVLSCKDDKPSERLQSEVVEMGGNSVKQQKHKFLEEPGEFWESHLNALEVLLGIAMRNGESYQVKRCLYVAMKPLSVLRTSIGYKSIAEADRSIHWRNYDFIRFYLKALSKLLEIVETEHVLNLARTVRKSVLQETEYILKEMDYHTMELYTWLVQQMYTLIQDAGDKAKKLQEMRAQFGGFYEFAGYWLEEDESKNPEDSNKMRLVLHEGLTKWLLVVIKNKDVELIEQLCEAGRRIVFGNEGIKFDNKEVVTQHFILAGHLIDLVKSGDVNTTAVKNLFSERYSHELKVDLDALVKFYLGHALPFKKIDSYLRIFYPFTTTHINLFTGSSHASGHGTTGDHEMSLAFIFLASHALMNCTSLPDPISDMSGRITENDINAVSECFGDAMIQYGCEQLKNWVNKCAELKDAEEAKEIADAEIDNTKAEEHERKFWEGYSRSVPFLSMCLKNGNYEIDNNVKNELIYHLPKIALFNWRYPLIGGEGDRYGSSIGRKMENKLFKNIIEGCKEESKIEGGLSVAIVEAVKWLEKEECFNDNGIVIVAIKRFFETELSKDNDFVPSWREDVKSRGFNGFYRGYPIKWLREDEGEEEETEGEKEENKKEQCQKVVAVDLRGWIGLRVRKEVLGKPPVFGELNIRTWRDDEIQQAIDSGKLDAKETDKAKGNCPVNVTFFWESIKNILPKTRTLNFDILKKET